MTKTQSPKAAKKLPPQILFSVGDPVVQALEPFKGAVVGVRLDEGTGEPRYKVAYKDPETGDNDVREFSGEQIKDAPADA